ncbi:hypothetical protein J6590_026453 [Homalodisca vitripennis]|nr:hypothetical protein J6590_026453 [Homalodisca vitripennis]
MASSRRLSTVMSPQILNLTDGLGCKCGNLTRAPLQWCDRGGHYTILTLTRPFLFLPLSILVEPNQNELRSRDHFWPAQQKPMCHLNLMDVQERHITNRKCRDSGVQGQFDRSSLLREMTVGVGGVFFPNLRGSC